MRWVNRSTFTIRPTSGTKCIRIPVPKSAGPGPSPSGAWVIDPGWYGTGKFEISKNDVVG